MRPRTLAEPLMSSTRLARNETKDKIEHEKHNTLIK
jgi:hypothetical protein